MSPNTSQVNNTNTEKTTIAQGLPDMSLISLIMNGNTMVQQDSNDDMTRNNHHDEDIFFVLEETHEEPSPEKADLDLESILKDALAAVEDFTSFSR